MTALRSPTHHSSGTGLQRASHASSQPLNSNVRGHMKRLFPIIAISLASPLAYGWETPSKAISEFLIFETDGGRLTSETYGQYFKMYIAAPKDYDEPGWDEVTVVEDYKLLDVKCLSSKRCEAKVEFVLTPTKKLQVLGIVEHPNGTKEEKTYVIVKRGNSWLLEPGFGSPIITLKTYTSHKAKHGL